MLMNNNNEKFDFCTHYFINFPNSQMSKKLLIFHFVYFLIISFIENILLFIQDNFIRISPPQFLLDPAHSPNHPNPCLLSLTLSLSKSNR